ncbi:hypothetical protein AK812_SmicGene41395 [Symbiodinium microadriaticum]|uniref:Uncharacterized protein n=1 Tax=Symbiodinium microadriaticum TaxID=2951 RepID=A0A1Q9C671_SYMMI|nr:hypothetical protein AK812_SmicGene41395 [Symbiodinium microadriaticum]
MKAKSSWLRWEDSSEEKVEDFYSNMSWDIGSGRIYKALFKLIRHLRESLPPPDRKLKGICKTIAEKKKAEAEAGEEEHECQDEGEQGEEEEPDDDECLEVKEIEAGKDVGGSPVRRLPKKTATSAEDVLYLGTAKSQEQRELDDIMEKIRLLEIARSAREKKVSIGDCHA